jgi:hypothetical protein
MVTTIVDDAEDLYRSIRADDYSYQDKKLFFSSTAFDDREMKPSVDRSSMRGNPAVARIGQVVMCVWLNQASLATTLASSPLLSTGQTSD